VTDYSFEDDIDAREYQDEARREGTVRVILLVASDEGTPSLNFVRENFSEN